MTVSFPTYYRVTMASGYRWTFAAILTEASAPLYLVNEDSELCTTAFRTADARHRALDAAKLLWPLECQGDGDDPSDDTVGSVV